ncbi:glycine cleavage system aminomethyltransferase GcvT [Telmatospirillum sp. J64-1]|uniref:glycine cleavage system aminomethyltransferase GcvT n=1 Tax=Telmatospirillum sp. J64-1 TaxID=2502183 RepID=UPI00163D8245|nr:glycine cleavage system aminomethyltransferase GcvT [Telmatospirillum sp. J64-1]
MVTDSDQILLSTPLAALHRELGARMVPFAGYSMPVQYPEGILKEHLHCRSQAGLFDVSHMGQLVLRGPGLAAALERLVPGDIQALAPGRQRYTLLTNEDGGIIDDLMVANGGDYLALVVNAACTTKDVAHLRAGLPDEIEMTLLDGQALLALQGPAAAKALGRLLPAVAEMRFMDYRVLSLEGVEVGITRSGYTGEDGFEISLPGQEAENLARRLLDMPDVAPVGLGARDSLRLEAGLCLYGADIDATTTPVEANLTWTISKRRRAEGGFPGAEIILRQIKEGTVRRRVGIRPAGRAPARAHTEITDADGQSIGEITSGGFGPSVGGPVAMGYVDTSHAEPGTPLRLMVRGKVHDAQVVALPFVQHRYVTSS